MEPTNRDLQRSIQEQNRIFADHARDDVAQFTAIHEHIDNVATKQDIEQINKKLDPIIDVYKAVVLSRSFVVGLAGVVIAITAIGAGFVWLINSVIQD